MKAPKMQYCSWCGEELGIYVQPYPYQDTCGRSECNREMAASMRAEAEDRAQKAYDDEIGGSW